MKTLQVIKLKRPETNGLYILKEYVNFGETKPHSIVNKEDLQRIYDEGYFRLEGDIEDVI